MQFVFIWQTVQGLVRTWNSQRGLLVALRGETATGNIDSFHAKSTTAKSAPDTPSFAAGKIPTRQLSNFASYATARLQRSCMMLVIYEVLDHPLDQTVTGCLPLITLVNVSR